MSERLKLAMMLPLLLWSGARAAVPAAGAFYGVAARVADGAIARELPACAACHGAAGQGVASLATTPYLAGLPAAYLARQLRNMASGARKAGAMSALAHTLTAAQRKALARHFAALPRPRAPPRSHPLPSSARGRNLAEHGRWSQGLPACELCHGRGGVGVGSAFPPLAGQPSAYLASQLRDFETGARPAGPMGLMKVVAGKLTDQDIQAVAAYFSSQAAARGTREVP